MTVIERVRMMGAEVEEDAGAIGVRSTGERLAVALVLGQVALLPPGFGGLGAAEAYIDPPWREAARQVRKERMAGSARGD